MKYLTNLHHPVFWLLVAIIVVIYLTCCLIKFHRENCEWEKVLKNLVKNKEEETEEARIARNEREYERRFGNKRDSKGWPMTHPYYLLDGSGGHRKCPKCKNTTFVCIFQLGIWTEMECCQCGTKLRFSNGGTSARRAF